MKVKEATKSFERGCGRKEQWWIFKGRSRGQKLRKKDWMQASLDQLCVRQWNYKFQNKSNESACPPCQPASPWHRQNKTKNLWKCTKMALFDHRQQNNLRWGVSLRPWPHTKPSKNKASKVKNHGMRLVASPSNFWIKTQTKQNKAKKHRWIMIREKDKLANEEQRSATAKSDKLMILKAKKPKDKQSKRRNNKMSPPKKRQTWTGN